MVVSDSGVHLIYPILEQLYPGGSLEEKKMGEKGGVGL